MSLLERIEQGLTTVEDAALVRKMLEFIRSAGADSGRTSEAEDLIELAQ